MGYLKFCLRLLFTFGAPIFVTCLSHAVSGTGDGAGGNTCLGRPIESYAFDVARSDAYVNRISPILMSLNGGNSDIARLLGWSIREKNWYLVPCGLPQIPSRKIGVVVDTEQAAIQTFTEVWLDENLFQKMNLQQQGDLILHEMLIGFKLLKFESSFVQCKAFAPRLDYCDGHSQNKRGGPGDLTPQDYAEVRRAGFEIFNLPLTSSLADWEDFFARRNFGNDYKFLRRKEDLEKVSASEFAQRVRTAQLTGFTPTFASVVRNDRLVFGRCTVHFDFNESATQMKTVVSFNGRSAIERNFALPSTVNIQGFTRGHQILKSSYFSDEKESRSRVGDRAYSLSLSFSDTDQIAKVQISELVCVKVSEIAGANSCGGWASPKNALAYSCSDLKDGM